MPVIMPLVQFEDRERKKTLFHIYYTSRTLDHAQINYSITQKELLAVDFALDKFRSNLIGLPIIYFTDHVAFKFLLSKKESLKF